MYLRHDKTSSFTKVLRLKREGDFSPSDFLGSLFMVETHQLLILSSFIYIILIKIIYINIFSSQFSTNHSFYQNGLQIST